MPKCLSTGMPTQSFSPCLKIKIRFEVLKSFYFNDTGNHEIVMPQEGKNSTNYFVNLIYKI